MRIEVDPERCSGHGRCWTLAPDVFEADDDGYCASRSVEIDGTDEAVVAVALRGLRSCPEHAIRVLE